MIFAGAFDGELHRRAAIFEIGDDAGKAQPLDRALPDPHVIGAYAGVFAAAWMIVPDLPLFLGWMLLFTASWEVAKNQKCDAVSFLMLASGAAIAMLSKYSGVIAAGSAGLAILIWGGSARLHALGAIAAGFVLGILPPLVWNLRNEWGSLMYQLRDRHGGGGFSGGGGSFGGGGASGDW